MAHSNLLSLLPGQGLPVAMPAPHSGVHDFLLGTALQPGQQTEDIFGHVSKMCIRDRIYDAYGYGYGDDREGATLTILMEPQDTGTYAMPAGGWCIYANLSEERGSSQALADAIHNAVEPSMAQRAWNGEEITMSAVALTQAVE